MLDSRRLAPLKHRKELKTILKASPYVKDVSCPTIKVTTYGADPTGVKDSTDAFNKAISELLSRRNPNSTMADGIYDMGGAVIDLEGGNYTISDTLLFPYFYGNYQLKDGAIRASNSFPSSKFLLEFGGYGECSNKQGSCIENIGLSHMFFDGNHKALGNVRITKTMGATLGPQLFFTGFTKYGLYLQDGHESILHQTWFGSYYYEYPENERINFKDDDYCTAIVVKGNDHIITDTIIFSTALGVDIYNQATLINNLHTWNGGKYGIIIRSDYVRMTNSYLDYSRLKIEGNIGHLLIENTFFLESTVLLEPHSQSATCQDFFLLNSDYQTYDYEKGPSIVYSQEFGKYTTIHNVKVENIFHNQRDRIRMTKVQLNMKQNNATSWIFDLTDRLVFNRIGSIQYSIQNDNNEVISSYIKPIQDDNKKIEIITSKPVTGTVYLTVDENSDN